MNRSRIAPELPDSNRNTEAGLAVAADKAVQGLLPVADDAGPARCVGEEVVHPACNQEVEVEEQALAGQPGEAIPKERELEPRGALPSGGDIEVGERVALGCSGEPGIYAMASLVMEILDGMREPAARRIAVRVVPGVSAFQAAAARAGAPIGHDFCAVSLSDLLTPREVIEDRLAAAARADFVIALYNPVSKARRETFERALRILREHRAAKTPVVVARNLGRAGEGEHLDPAAIDMLTVLIVGSSQTRTFAQGGRRRAYTPRGYDIGAGRSA